MKFYNRLKIHHIFLLAVCAGAPAFAAVAPVAATKAADAPVDAAKPVASKEVQGTISSGSYLSGQFARSSGDTDSAVRYLQSVYQTDKQNSEIASQLMGLLLLQGKVDSAMAIANDIAKANGRDPIAALMLSLQAIKAKDTVKASKILDEAFEEEGGQLWLPLVSAWLDVENKKFTKPLTLEELSAEVGRAAPVVNYHLALINAQAGFPEAAAQNFKDAVEDPVNPPPRVMQMLLRFYDKNNSPEILKPIVTAYRAANPDVTVADEVRIDNVQDGVAEVLYTMGSIMLSADATQDAMLYLQLALYMKPNMYVATFTLADAYNDSKQFGVANELYGKIPPASKLYTSAKLHIALGLEQMHKSPEAIAKLDALIKESPDLLEAYIAKGDILRVHEKFADAVAAYSAGIDSVKTVKPQHWVLFFARGTCFERLQNWPEAEKNLRKALELKPGQPDVLNYLGFSMLTRNENLPEARDMIAKALEQKPEDPQIIDSMGWALYMLGKYDDSVQYMEKAVAQLPADAEVNDHLGDVYWRLGRKTEARYQWERALTYSPEATLETSIQKKLKDGLPAAPTPTAAAPTSQKTAKANTDVATQ